ncbi:putative 2-hydroxyisoflavanone dehydratase, Carboxylesterase [Helianthus annuus]|uniref:2-hydroxyisoflavanone dehydratase isoform X2 n=1 Tax=Helianthus annuus TaxID=4232 RepID=UPI000B8F0FEC|nr:2-hydroxyisoflavanone dehydratase isoform X2 [Helianthus annuus]KAJ0599866.1 putative 2-hydroxyisoflavanone dehydratase, Carboxylesterase [Helianthus annuus]
MLSTAQLWTSNWVINSNPIEEKHVTAELLPFLRVHNDGTVERLYNPQLAPPSSLVDGVRSKDTVISPEVSARLYLPCNTTEKLPILVYFHGGGFCIESAFSILSHQYINTIASQANALVISVDYRLAPEHPLPAAYEDSWTALQWVATHSTEGLNEKDEPWLIQHGDFNRLYIGGDSAGANISHHIAMRVGTEELHGGVKILGAFLSHPYFWGSEPLGSEPVTSRETSLLYRTWMLVYPGAPEGIDNPHINPFAKTAPCLAGIGCRRLIVCVASQDELRDRAVHYYDAMREGGWEGELSVFEVEGEGHGFHIFNPNTKNAKEMFKRLAGFLQVS